MSNVDRDEERLERLMKIPIKPPKSERQKAQLVCVDGRIVGDAMVIVSPRDPNWWRTDAWRTDGEMIVKREANERARLLVARLRKL